MAALLKEAGYSLQANRKTREGASHPDRNAQFQYISRQVIACRKRRQRVVSVDVPAGDGGDKLFKLFFRGA